MSRVFFGKFDLFDTVSGWQKANQGALDTILVACAAVLVTLFILAWAVFVRKRRREPEHHYQPAQALENSEGKTSKRRKWRRRRRDHRPRNPTLAETGGLPPVKTEVPPETFN